MALIPKDEIERLKREVSVQRLAEARGIKLTRSGKQLMGLCPFHKDTDPSLRIDPAENVWKCFGACNEGGDAIQWVMRAEGISFRHAVELLKRDHIPATVSAEPPPKHATTRKLPPLFQQTHDGKKLLEIVVSHYHDTLKQSPEAQQYLVKRGLQSAEMVQRFRLGYADRTLGYRLPASNRNAGEEQRTRLKELGVLRNQKPGHEHFNGSLVIPICNLQGEIVQMYGRKIRDDLRAGIPDHLYLPGPMRGVWNEEALLASKEIILCEALIDALTFWGAGYRHVTSIYGVNGFTDELRAAFKQHGTKRIYLAYDRDEAGDNAARKHAEELMSLGIECFRVQFPKGQDANEYARTTKPAAKALGVMLHAAAWLGTGKRSVTNVIALPATPAIPESIEEETIKPAAKEKTSVPAPAAKEPPALPLVPAATTEPAKTTPALRAEKLFSFAAASEVAPREEVPARPMPLAAPAEPVVKTDGEEIHVTIGPRTYRVLGLEKNTSLTVLKINLRVTGTNVRGEFCHHGDTLDMELARQRMAFSKQAAHELGVKEDTMHREVGRLWTTLGDLHRERLRKSLEKPEEETAMSAEEQAAALELLRDPRLLERVLSDFEKCGVVGEETNKKVSYLAAVSRLLEKPLAVVVQSASAAGKSSLMEAVLDFMPEEQREEYSAMTGQALYYMGQKNLKHKILAVSEEEGASRAAYALKLLQSEGVLKIASTGKDPVSGKLVTHEYMVEGPVMIFLTTTAQNVDEELMNRAIVLTVDEEREQTRAIHRKQREARTLEGHWARRKRDTVVRMHRNAQRLLRPLTVVNNHGLNTFPDHATRTRRDYAKLLTLIEAIALLHQHQREIKTDTRDGDTLEYIEATLEDVKLAEALVSQVVRPSLDDLPAHTRRLLALLDTMVTEECERLEAERGEYRFSRRTVREYTRWGDTQLRVHLKRLEEMEYLIVRRGGAQGQLYLYQLRSDYDTNFAGLEGSFAGVKENFAGGSRVLRGGGKNEESPITTGTRGATSRVRGNAHLDHARGEGENGVVGTAPLKPNGAARTNGAAHREAH